MLYLTLNDHQRELERQGVDDRMLLRTIKEEQRVTAAEIAVYEQRQRRAYDQSDAEYDKCERYCRKQQALPRQLEDLAESEREMNELDHAKDQVMTTLKLARANLVLWVRDTYFPATYAQATWHRLEHFFQLPGRVVWEDQTVAVDLRPFNDRQLTHDLVAPPAGWAVSSVPARGHGTWHDAGGTAMHGMKTGRSSAEVSTSYPSWKDLSKG